MSVESRPDLGVGNAGAANGAKVAEPWTGAVMALGAIVAIVGTVLTMGKLVVFENGSATGTFTYTAWTHKVTGHGFDGLTLTSPKAGSWIEYASVVGLILGLVILRGAGRTWVRVLGLLAGLAAAGSAAIALAAPKSNADDLNAVAQGVTVHGLLKMGSTIALIGAGVLALAALVSLFARRPAA